MEKLDSKRQLVAIMFTDLSAVVLIRTKAEHFGFYIHLKVQNHV